MKMVRTALKTADPDLVSGESLHRVSGVRYDFPQLSGRNHSGHRRDWTVSGNALRGGVIRGVLRER